MPRVPVGAVIKVLRWSATRRAPIEYKTLTRLGALREDTFDPAADHPLTDALEVARGVLPQTSWLPVVRVDDTASVAHTVHLNGGQSQQINDQVLLITDPDEMSALAVSPGAPAQLDLAGTARIAHGATLPALPGTLCWLDLLTPDGGEADAAAFWCAAFSWHTGRTISFPPDKKYITLLDGVSTSNRSKIMGVLPRSVWPHRDSDCYGFVPMFMAPDANTVHTVAEVWGDVVQQPMEADGTVAILRDDDGALFGCYHRTDNPDQVKE